MDEKIYKLLTRDAGEELALYIYNEIDLTLKRFNLPNASVGANVGAIPTDNITLLEKIMKYLNIHYMVNDVHRVDFYPGNDKLIVAATIILFDDILIYPGANERYNELKDLIDKTDYSKIINDIFSTLKGRNCYR